MSESIETTVIARSIVLLKFGGEEGDASHRYKDVAPILKLCPRRRNSDTRGWWSDRYGGVARTGNGDTT